MASGGSTTMSEGEVQGMENAARNFSGPQRVVERTEKMAKEP